MMYAIIKLSQLSYNLTVIDYNAIKHIYCYLRDTNFGIHYWRAVPNMDCPLLPLPKLTNDNNTLENITQDSVTEEYRFIDVDWAGDVSKGKYVTWLAIMLTGGPI